MDVTEVQAHLAGASYPASGEELAAVAEDNGAPETVIETLRDLGEEELDGPVAVADVLDVDELDEGWGQEL